MITLVALLEVSNIAFKLSDLQYDALVAQIPSQQSSQLANLFSRRIVGTHIDVYYCTIEESMKVGLISLIQCFYGHSYTSSFLDFVVINAILS
jgi:hypothetical protein